MRRGHDGEGIGSQAVLVEPAGRHERRELERLGGGAEEDELVWVTGRGEPLARRCDDRYRAAMARFDAVAAGDLDQDRGRAPAYWPPPVLDG
jgi:hypothetical protein